MSITDELREYFGKSKGTFTDYVLSIADRIDVEHERQLDVLYRDMSDAEWVRLPKDADGVPIRVGDELCNYTLSGYPYPNGGVYCKAIVNERMVLVGQKESSFKDLLMWEASWCHHHHAPTVEDVLTEFGIDWEHESDCEDRAALLKEYATKLRLAETEDA